MSRKIVKIPAGDISVVFIHNGQEVQMTSKMLWDAIMDSLFQSKPEETKESVTTFTAEYDDENPDSIRGTEDGI